MGETLPSYEVREYDQVNDVWITQILFVKILRIGILKIGYCLKLSCCCFSDEIDSVFANMADFYFGAVSIGKCDLRLLLKIGDTG